MAGTMASLGGSGHSIDREDVSAISTTPSHPIQSSLVNQLNCVILTQLGGPASNTDGEQMRAAGEGEIYKAQQEKTGFGEQGDLAADMDRKREEQDRIKEERGEEGGEGEVDVEAAVGGRGKGFVGVNSGSGGRGVED